MSAEMALVVRVWAPQLQRIPIRAGKDAKKWKMDLPFSLPANFGTAPQPNKFLAELATMVKAKATVEFPKVKCGQALVHQQVQVASSNRKFLIKPIGRNSLAYPFKDACQPAVTATD